MAQHGSHTDETIAYTEDYPDWSHLMKDIFLEFPVSKRAQAKSDEEQKELQHQQVQINQRVSPSNRRQVPGQDCNEEKDRCINLIHSPSLFNFIKINLPIWFGDQIRQFGNILMYSTDYEEIAQNEQITDP